MAKVILICGKPCSGKTYYAKYLIKVNSAVLLSSDEIGLALFGSNGLYEHGSVVVKLQNYLYQKSLEIVETGINVIIDWGFWKQTDRQEASAFFKKYDVDFEWHYIDATDEVLRKNLNKRNREIVEGKTLCYYVDENLVNGFWDMFEVPAKEEMDFWIDNRML